MGKGSRSNETLRRGRQAKKKGRDQRRLETLKGCRVSDKLPPGSIRVTKRFAKKVVASSPYDRRGSSRKVSNEVRCTTDVGRYAYKACGIMVERGQRCPNCGARA